MNTPSIGNQADGGGGAFALGQGWGLPAVLVALFVVLFYLPAHHAGEAGGDELIAATAGLYVIGLSVIAPRLVRGAILRLAGSHEPIVLFGRAGDAITTGTLRPRWRLAAIVAGAATSSLAVLGSAALSGAADPRTYAHAIAGLALGANLVLAAGALVPVPGFTGWALLLGIVDAAGTRADLRVRRAARIVHGVGFPVFLSLGMGGALIGDPMLMLVGFLLAMLSWTQVDLAVGNDLVARFLSSRVAADIARPVTSHAAADQLVEQLMTSAADTRAVTVVETRGALVGAIGPRQLAERDPRRPGQRCSELMVPIASVPLLPAGTPAARLLSMLARHGFVLIRISDGLAYIEAADMLERIVGRDAEPGGVSP